MKEYFRLLNQYKSKLTKQQYKTFKGQILAGDTKGNKRVSYVVLCSEIEYLQTHKEKTEVNPYEEMNIKVESDIGQQINVEDSLPF